MNDEVNGSSEVALAAALDEHDRALASRGLDVWVGAEPTFTDRFSVEPPWLSEALGGDKEVRATVVLTRLYAPGAAIVRSVGRQYPGEPEPRWSLGLYARRDGAFAWHGPPDPLLLGSQLPLPVDAVERFAEETLRRLRERGWPAVVVGATQAGEQRVLFRRDGGSPVANISNRPQLLRGSTHERPIPAAGLRDFLAECGDYLLVATVLSVRPDSTPQIAVDLPDVTDVTAFLGLLEVLGSAGIAAGLPALVLRGYPPPVDAAVAWTTLTPDPAVVEINGAPAPDAASFYRWADQVYGAARATGLWPFRLQYNGVVSDSGGAGHLTLGGPSPAESPFFRVPALLPRLIYYLNHHPALSFWFANTSIGATGQSPRPDEGSQQMFAELELALELLERHPDVGAEVIARSLSPFVVDCSGNTHRSELNLEKLWNPALPGRGCLGLVEFRALRMARTAEDAAARACLLRAIVALLAERAPAGRLRRWGAELHDRFALPFYLRLDLGEVLADLESVGLGLTEPIAARLRDEPARFLGSADLDGIRIEIEQAMEFWPLVGDVASQERGGARLVDPSTTRLQVSLRSAPGVQTSLPAWCLGTGRHRLPLRSETDERGPVRLIGLRYRNFRPAVGLHPLIEPRDRIELRLWRPGHERGLRVTVHEWRPDSAPYDGLPADLEDARVRRANRVTAEVITANLAADVEPPATTLTPYCCDLRRL